VIAREHKNYLRERYLLQKERYTKRQQMKKEALELVPKQVAQELEECPQEMETRSKRKLREEKEKEVQQQQQQSLKKRVRKAPGGSSDLIGSGNKRERAPTVRKGVEESNPKGYKRGRSTHLGNKRKGGLADISEMPPKKQADQEIVEDSSNQSSNRPVESSGEEGQRMHK
jgi:hypothetical protein